MDYIPKLAKYGESISIKRTVRVSYLGSRYKLVWLRNISLPFSVVINVFCCQMTLNFAVSEAWREAFVTPVCKLQKHYDFRGG